MNSSTVQEMEENAMNTRRVADETTQAAVQAILEASEKRQEAINLAYSEVEASQARRLEKEIENMDNARTLAKEGHEAARNRSHQADGNADDMVVKAVCAASLIEYKEIQRIQVDSHERQKKLQVKKEEAKSKITNSVREAQRAKTEAMQRVIDLKVKAHQMKEKAKAALAAVEEKKMVAEIKLADIRKEDLEKEKQSKLDEIQGRAFESKQRKDEALKKAAEAKRRAIELQRKALEASQSVKELKIIDRADSEEGIHKTKAA